jgi:hypothetical protein
LIYCGDLSLNWVSGSWKAGGRGGFCGGKGRIGGGGDGIQGGLPASLKPKTCKVKKPKTKQINKIK